MKSPWLRLTQTAEVMTVELLEYRVERMHQSRSWELEEHQDFRTNLSGEGYGVTQAGAWLCCLPLMGSDSKVNGCIDVPEKWGQQLLPTLLVKQ
jgi:hypothetical protein